MFKKILITSVLFILLSVSAFSLSWSDVSFSAGTSTDYYTGEVREIVYPDSGWTNDYLSELIWQIDNIIMLTGDFNVALNNYSLHISGSTAVNKGTGEMDDYDWGDNTTSTWTNWSNSDIFLDKSFILDTELIYNLDLTAELTVPIGIGYKLNYFHWSDKAGKYIYYGSWNESGDFYYFEQPAIGDFGGVAGIDYTFVQNILFLTSGIQHTKGPLTGSLNASFSPYIYAWDLDHHILRHLFFMDKFTSHVWYRLHVSMKYSFNKAAFLKFSINFEELPEITGDTYYYNEDPADSDKVGSYTGYADSGAGLASRILNISIGYTYQF